MEFDTIRKCCYHFLIFAHRSIFIPNFGAHLGAEDGCFEVMWINSQDFLTDVNTSSYVAYDPEDVGFSMKKQYLIGILFQALLNDFKCKVVIGLMNGFDGPEINTLNFGCTK